MIAIDGKTVRRSYDEGKNKGAIHMISAWASQNRLVLGQRKVDDKSNEITAIPELLKVLDINGCIVTIDAMGTQKKIAQQIIEQGGDYVFPKEIRVIFLRMYNKFLSRHKAKIFQEWSMTSIAMVESVRKSEGQTSREVRYYISSLPPDAKQLAESIRSHGEIENPLHWVLDVAFREDECPIRTGHAPENLALLRHLALSALNQEKTAKLGIHNKRRRARWDNDYLLQVLAG